MLDKEEITIECQEMYVYYGCDAHLFFGAVPTNRDRKWPEKQQKTGARATIVVPKRINLYLEDGTIFQELENVNGNVPFIELSTILNKVYTKSHWVSNYQNLSKYPGSSEFHRIEHLPGWRGWKSAPKSRTSFDHTDLSFLVLVLTLPEQV